MKRIMLLAISIMLVGISLAQVNEGTIVFEQKIDMHRRISADDAQMKAMIPHFRSSKFELVFANAQSLYKMLEAEPDVTENTGGGDIVMRFGGANTEYYKNFNMHKQVEKRELAEKAYIIEDTLHTIQWKLGDESKFVLGHNCKQAIGKTERGSDVEAWYTEDITVSSGPEMFTGLPGMVLLADVNKGEFVYTALELKKISGRKQLKAPTGGKKITNAEFVKLQKEIFGDQKGPVRLIRN